ncbi:MAG: protein kinase [Gammaproteobacteria bacterium]
MKKITNDEKTGKMNADQTALFIAELTKKPLGKLMDPNASDSLSKIIDFLPMSSILDVLKLVSDKIPAYIDAVMMNKQQMRSLAERVKAVVDATQRLPRTPDAQKKYAEPLNRLRDTVLECAEWVVAYSDKGLILRVFNSSSYQIKFEDLYSRLAEHVQDLQLGLNVQEWLDVKRQKEERDQDLEYLKNHQIALLNEIKNATEQVTDMKIKGEDRKEIISKKMSAIEHQIQLLLNANVPNEQDLEASKREAVDPRLLIDYCDIDPEEKIGEGGFGKIYRGHWGDQQVVIKEVDGMSNPIVKAEFIREVKILSQLRSAYIVQLNAVCLQNQRSCYLMEYMENGDLSVYLQKNPKLTYEQRYNLAFEIASGLVYLHARNIIHCDLKTANILVNKNGHAKLADFGLAKALNLSSSLPALPQNKSSQAWSYLAPEVLLGYPYTMKSEVYSYGMVLWEILTGKKPYAALDNDVNVIHHVTSGGRERLSGFLPEFFIQLLQDCWQELPSKRPTMNEIKAVLLAHKPVRSNDTLSQNVSLKLESSFPTGPREVSPECDVTYQLGLNFALHNGDYVNALRLLNQAAELGHTRARTDLALIYLQGLGNTTPNPILACQLLQQSAVENHLRAMQALVQELQRGTSIAPNPQAVSFWQDQISSAEKRQKLREQQASLPEGVRPKG